MTGSPIDGNNDTEDDPFTFSEAEIDKLISASQLSVGLDSQTNIDIDSSLVERIDQVDDWLNCLPRQPWIPSPDLTVSEALADLPDIAVDVHNIYIDGLKSGTGGREGMIAALSVVTALTWRVMQNDVRRAQLLEPIVALNKSLRELSLGVENPALAKSRAKRGRPAASPHSRRLAFIVRCVWAVEACEEMGDRRPYHTVHGVARSASEQFFAGSRYSFQPSTIERWRIKHKREIDDRRLETINWIPLPALRHKALLLGLSPENLDRSFDLILHDLGLRLERAPHAEPDT